MERKVIRRNDWQVHIYRIYEKLSDKTRRNCIPLVFFGLTPYRRNGFDWHLPCRLCQRRLR